MNGDIATENHARDLNVSTIGPDTQFEIENFDGDYISHGDRERLVLL